MQHRQSERYLAGFDGFTSDRVLEIGSALPEQNLSFAGLAFLLADPYSTHFATGHETRAEGATGQREQQQRNGRILVEVPIARHWRDSEPAGESSVEFQPLHRGEQRPSSTPPARSIVLADARFSLARTKSTRGKSSRSASSDADKPKPSSDKPGPHSRCASSQARCRRTVGARSSGILRPYRPPAQKNLAQQEKLTHAAPPARAVRRGRSCTAATTGTSPRDRRKPAAGLRFPCHSSTPRYPDAPRER